MTTPAPTIPAELLGMPALTMLPPWGTAIARWGKSWENRGWKPAPKLIGKRICIHQGALQLRKDGTLARDIGGREVQRALGRISSIVALPSSALDQVLADAGSIIATALLADCVSVLPKTAISLFADPGREIERSPWMMVGGYAWHLTDIKLCKPLKINGLQKVWTVHEHRLPRAA